jgi:hypothetical protein
MWDMELFHQIDTSEVTEDGDNIRYHTTFLTSQFEERPSLIAPIEVYE